MKKLFAIALTVVMLAALTFSCFALPAARQEIAVYKNTPTLDGIILEDEWDAENALEMTTENCNPWTGEVSNGVTFYYGWDDTGLYVAAHVVDNDVVQPADTASVYNMDAFQIALDPAGLIGNAGGGGGMFFSIGLTVDNVLGAVYHPYGGGSGDPFEYTGAGRICGDGWEFEMVIPWTSIEILANDGYEFHHGDGQFINAIICMLDRDDGGSTVNCYKTSLSTAPDSFKPADYALQLVLHDEIAPSLVVEVEDEAEDDAPAAEAAAEAPKTSAKTADASVLLAVVGILGSGIVISKKH